MVVCEDGSLFDIELGRAFGVSGAKLDGSCKLAPDLASDRLFVACATQLAVLSCKFKTGGGTCTSLGAVTTAAFGVINATVAHPSMRTKGATAVWVSGSGGTFVYDVPVGGAPEMVYTSSASSAWAITPLFDAAAAAPPPAVPLVALGNDSKLVLLDARDFSVARWVWVTDVSTGEGGPVDDAVTSLAWDAASNVLYIGNPT
jgi:hypothetical protein